MKKILVTFLFSLILICNCIAQTTRKSNLQDTLAFRRYLSNNIGTVLDMESILTSYKQLKGQEEELVHRPSDVLWNDPFDSTTYNSMSGPITGATIVTPSGGGSESYSRMGKGTIPRSVRNHIHDKARAYFESIKDVEAEKAILVHNLQAFDSLSNNKPVCFAVIHQKYNGDIKAYVENLYNNSFMANEKTLKKFLRHPSSQKMRKDPVVQFSLSLALYELWVKEVREGNIKDK